MSKTTWERTSVQNLLRNGSSGRYYGRWTITVNGKSKQKWVNLKTDKFSVAKLRIIDEAARIERMRGSRLAVEAGTGTVGDLMRVYEERTKATTELKPRSIAARLVALKKIRKTWPGLETMKQNLVRPAAVAAWASRFKAEGTGFTPPGAKKVIRGNSATSVNRAIDTLRGVMEIAVERGAIHANPVPVEWDGRSLKKELVRNKPDKLPSVSLADMQRLFVAMENNGARGGWGIEAADFCRFLYNTGCRVGEVPGVIWQCVDWDKKRLRVFGLEQENPEHNRLKSESSVRILPLFGELEALLKKVIERRKSAAKFTKSGKPLLESSDRVFHLSECQKTIDAACAAIGIPRLTHHDFRHLFATRCIEAGVDIPTVSRWLGHSDGGALAMRTYGHLRDEHSQSMAAKVSFGTTKTLALENR